jgi:hypothetical protein
MVFFVPVLLVIIGIAIYKGTKHHGLEKRKLKAEAARHATVAGKGHGEVHYYADTVDIRLHDCLQQRGKHTPTG